MFTALKRLAPAALLMLLACQPRVAEPIYGAWEEGLTLTFEDPSLPQPQRSAERTQVRVAKASLTPGKPILALLTVTNTHGQLSLPFRYEKSGVALLNEQGQVSAEPLPVDFANRPSWMDQGVEYQALGRAAWDGAALLPETSDPIGLWIESRSPQGGRRRTLLLPNVGEVETRVYRDGTWVTVNRLVARGFTDLPVTKRS